MSAATDRPAGLELAVVGMSGRFPGAADVAALWRNLRDGVDAVSALTDEDLRRAGVPGELRADPRYVRAEGVLEGADLFDAGFFGLSAREAAMLDPQQRIFLECAWHALEDAGHDPARFAGRVGVYAGAGAGGYLAQLLADPRRARELDPTALRLANDRDFLPARVSYKLGLQGPSVNVQTACSTSLVAVHLACQALLSGDCDMALAGGVTVAIPQGAGYLYRPGSVRSPEGRCRAFDADAAGLVSGSGAGVVVLRRLDDALADGDTVRAVVLGSAVGNDGAQRIGFTAPCVPGQAAVLRAALAAAGVPPDSIGYVEAHGTGTELGDPIEVAALCEAYGPRAPGSCALGSVKTNLGHLDAAAGVTGLIKTVLSLQHGELVPSLHFRRPNPRIDFGRNPFQVVTALRPWTRSGVPRRAGVSAFGLGGTNAHVVLEEAPAGEPASPGREWQLLTVSARTPAALEAAASALAAHLRAHPAPPLADVAYTHAVGRRAFAHRRAVLVRQGEDAAALLASRAPERTREGTAGEGAAPVVFLFPGQGAHAAGTARGLYDAEPVFRGELDRCAALLRPHLGMDLREVLLPAAGATDAAAARLGETRLAQPAVFAVCWALARLWASLGVEPEAVAGQGAGELVAACVAGVFTLEDALALVAERARLVHALPPGALLAVPLSEDQLAARLVPGADVAAAAPGACLAAGPADAVAALRRSLARDGVRARPVAGSHAFHSAMMEPAVEPFRRRVEQVPRAPARIPLVSTVSGRWLTAAEAADPAYWAGQLRRTVRFADALAELARVPERVFLEVSPGTALAGLVRRHPACAGRTTVSTLDGAGAEPEPAQLLRAAGALWAAGVPVRLEALHAGERRRRIPLPTYPFERRRYWMDLSADPAEAV
ncbi:MAG TPA: type I polyketide synthase [Longimicrobium sp.]